MNEVYVLLEFVWKSNKIYSVNVLIILFSVKIKLWSSNDIGFNNIFKENIWYGIV